jgi:DNA-binding transcriptional LysR family regulator
MEFQQIEMFVAVVETGNVTRGAERVFRTAPAVSVALKKLEEEIGTPLFDRSQRHPYPLTAAGRLLYSYATRILAMRTEVTLSIKHLVEDHQQNLRLGTHESISLYLLPSLMRTFNEAHPGVTTELVCGNTERLLAALANGTIDLALVGDPPDEPQLERHFIMRDELVLITSRQHRFASFNQVHVKDLAGQYLIVQGTKSMLRQRIVQAFHESETPFSVSVENIAIEAIKRMVAEGLGVGFVPLMCVREDQANEKLTILRVEGVRNEWNLSLVWRKKSSLSRTAQDFVDVTLRNDAEQSHDPQSELKKSSKQDRPFVIQPQRVVHC